MVTGRWRFVEERGPAVRGSAGPIAWPASLRQPARPCNKPLHPTALPGREQAGWLGKQRSRWWRPALPDPRRRVS